MQMTSMEIVSTNIQIYKPIYDEDTGLYNDNCPYKKYSRGQHITYTCPCISGRTLNSRQQFLQHFNSKTHTCWRENLGKDENIKVIKELRILNGKNENNLRLANNKIKLQSRQLSREINKIEMIKKNYNDYKSTTELSIKHTNKYIIDLEENIKILEKHTGLYIESCDYTKSNDTILTDESYSSIQTD
tara:strand:+ start:1255 stop:1818 length:564 start_codon:yes stop_codon:yes gene_type:complete